MYLLHRWMNNKWFQMMLMLAFAHFIHSNISLYNDFERYKYYSYYYCIDIYIYILNWFFTHFGINSKKNELSLFLLLLLFVYFAMTISKTKVLFGMIFMMVMLLVFSSLYSSIHVLFYFHNNDYRIATNGGLQKDCASASELNAIKKTFTTDGLNYIYDHTKFGS